MVGWLADSLITENNTQQSSSSIMSRSQQLQQQDHSGSAVDSTSLSAVSVMSGGARMMHQQRVFDVASINLPVGGGGGGAGSYR